MCKSVRKQATCKPTDSVILQWEIKHTYHISESRTICCRSDLAIQQRSSISHEQICLTVGMTCSAVLQTVAV